MRIALLANTDWYLYNFRRSLAIALRDAGHEVYLFSPPGDYGPRLLELGLNWRPVPMERRSLNPLREATLVLSLARKFRQAQVDLVHGFTIKCAIYGAVAARMAGIEARVSSVAGLGFVFISKSTKARILRPIVRGLLRLTLGGRSARVILQNPDDVELFERTGLAKPESIRMVRGSGVDCSRFFPVASVRADVPMRVLLPARLLWDKGLGDFIEAARELRDQGSAIEFLLAGDPDSGNPASVSADQVRAWVSEGVVQWLGHVEDMPRLFQSVDVVVLPSYREGLPKGLIEAGASGCALITTDVPGCREVVTHEKDGLVVPVKDARALANAIARMEKDPGLRNRLGHAARVKALSEFDERIVIERTVAVYRELLSA